VAREEQEQGQQKKNQRWFWRLDGDPLTATLVRDEADETE